MAYIAFSFIGDQGKRYGTDGFNIFLGFFRLIAPETGFSF